MILTVSEKIHESTTRVRSNNIHYDCLMTVSVIAMQVSKFNIQNFVYACVSTSHQQHHTIHIQYLAINSIVISMNNRSEWSNKVLSIH